MERVVYIAPSGEEIINPKLAQLLAFMRQGEEYWTPNGHMGILKRGNPPSAQLLFVRHPDWGWYVEYQVQSPPHHHEVTFDPIGNWETWIERRHHGQTSFFVEACFQPPSVGEHAVELFLEGKHPSSSGMWEPFQGGKHRRKTLPLKALLRRALGRKEPPRYRGADRPPW